MTAIEVPGDRVISWSSEPKTGLPRLREIRPSEPRAWNAVPDQLGERVHAEAQRATSLKPD
jgi:hypothetical protein